MRGLEWVASEGVGFLSVASDSFTARSLRGSTQNRQD